MLDLILRNARLPDGGDPVDVAVKDGRIAELRPEIDGQAAGRRADLVVLQCRDPIEALRLRPSRLFVLRGGRVIARCAPQRVELSLGGEAESFDPCAPAV